MKTQAVIGAGFGDEGKGKVVSCLCSKSENPLVIRYCGGQQAGHHVVIRNRLDHVCSNFGSGTLQGFDTYWSKYCTVDPIAILNELDVLGRKGISPILYLDERCPITTPYDQEYNRGIENKKQHGSCGVGVGQTIKREKDHYSLLVSDLKYPSVFRIKLELLTKKYYSCLGNEIDDFLRACEELISCPNIKTPSAYIFGDNLYDNCIFEGSQGLLLDQKIGFFPHVTRANTGTKNILEMVDDPIEIYLVTRAYQTRHGNGPMTNEDLPHKILPNPYEQNFDTGFQGKFRMSILDLDLMRYAIQKDPYLRQNNQNINLVITCLDLMQEYSLRSGGKTLCFDNEDQFIERIKRELQVGTVYLSRTPYPEIETYQ